jgi:hypothetical protein
MKDRFLGYTYIIGNFLDGDGVKENFVALLDDENLKLINNHE